MFPHHRLKSPPEPEPDQAPVKAPPPRPARPPLTLAGLIGHTIRYVAIFWLVFGVGAALGPGIPAGYNPLAPLDPEAPPGPFTALQLGQATATPDACFAHLDRIADLAARRLPDREESAVCHIRGHVELSRVGGASLAPVSTQCATALRLYLWERHAVRPAALRHFGAEPAGIGHLSSYNCRRIRTASGPGRSMSAHATAAAIDVRSVWLDNGRTLSLPGGWQSGDAAERAFWRELRDGGCDWFRTVLGPDYNRLHADHFHFAQGRYRACR